jgi:hypothetical protein
MSIPNGRPVDKTRRTVPRPDVTVIKEDLATLKRDLAVLFAHLETSEIESPAGAALKAVGQMGSETMRFCDTVAAGTQARSDELRRQVERRPLAMVLVACWLGVIVARMGDHRPPRR